MDIKALRREGHSIKAISRMTGHSRNTVRRVLREAWTVPTLAGGRLFVRDRATVAAYAMK